MRRSFAGIAGLSLAAALAGGCAANRSATAAAPLALGPAASAAIVIPVPAAAAPEDPIDLALATGGRQASPHRRLDVRIDRFWSENGARFAAVSVRNVATFDFAKVTLDCVGVGAAEAPIDLGRRTLVAPPEATMEPGATRHVEVKLGSAELHAMSCEARAL